MLPAMDDAIVPIMPMPPPAAGCIMGGAGSAVGEALQQLNLQRSVLHLGLPNEFIEHGDPVKLLALQGLDAAGMEASIRQRWPD